MSPLVTHAAAPECPRCAASRSFCPLPDDLRVVLERLKTTLAFQKGDVVFNESDPCHGVFVVCRGSLKLVTSSSEGRILLLRFAHPGEILGVAESLRGGAPYQCSAIAAESAVLAMIPHDTFLRFLASYPDLCVRIATVLSEQYKTAQRETRFLAFGETSTARLARLLLDWSVERGRQTEDGVHIPSRVTHTDLAQSIGSTRETVTRILGDLNHRGIVERTADEIVIHRPQELAELGSF